MFEKIAGYEEVKEELLRIREWILNRSNYENKNAKLPRGILFHGRPGNGKTLFLREYAESFNAPIIIIEGNESNICKEIHSAFQKSKKNDFTIILIDEIDLLISKRGDVERVLQAELDGIDSNCNVLVLATTNSIHSLEEALLRSGRFDRTIEIGRPNRKSRKELFDYYLKKMGIAGNVDSDYLSKITYGVSGADISAIVNDVYLRCGCTATTDDVEDSYYRIKDGVYNPHTSFDPKKANMEIAYHEVAHALLIYKNKNNFSFYRALFGKDCACGYTRSFPVDEDLESSESYFQRIEISLAGYVISKLKFHKLDGGCIDDLQKSREAAVRLVNKQGLIGPQYVLPWFDNRERMETEISKRRNEITIEHIIHKTEKTVRKYLKKHMKEIDKLVSIMMEKGYIDATDLQLVMEKLNSDSNSISEVVSKGIKIPQIART